MGCGGFADPIKLFIMAVKSRSILCSFVVVKVEGDEVIIFFIVFIIISSQEPLGRVILREGDYNFLRECNRKSLPTEGLKSFSSKDKTRTFFIEG